MRRRWTLPALGLSWLLTTCPTTLANGGGTNPPPEQLALLDEVATVVVGQGETLQLVAIPAGSFRMGAPTGSGPFVPQHVVTFTRPFLMSATEVTQGQYEAVMQKNPSKFQGAQHPVERVSWHDANRFCSLLSARTHRTVRLPSEAEWEYACRAGTTTAWYGGDDERGFDDAAWYHANAGGTTHAVGTKQVNPWGLFDMHGNVAEWCQDGWHYDYRGAPTDGSARAPATEEEVWPSTNARVLRGGGMGTHRSSAFLAYDRDQCHRACDTFLTGFRVVVELPR